MDVIREIQKWFQDHCDGKWEQSNRITITSCDNPGWWVKIDIRGTALESKSFNRIRTGDFSQNIPQPPWIDCYIEKGIFNGAGDVMQLSIILEYFIDWAYKGEGPVKQ